MNNFIQSYIDRPTFFQDWDLPEYYQWWCEVKRGLADMKAGRMITLDKLRRQLDLED